MARRTPIKRGLKKIRVTKSEAYVINHKYMGDEPALKTGFTDSEYGKVLNWYSYMATVEDAREYMTAWLKANGKVADAKRLAKVPDSYFPKTASWIARIMSSGTKMPKSAMTFFNDSVKKALGRVEEDKPVKKAKAVQKIARPTIQEKMAAKVGEHIAAFEQVIDDHEFDFSMFDYLTKNAIPAKYASSISAYYTGWLEELKEALKGKDEDLKVAYRNMSKALLKTHIEFFTRLLDDCARYGSNQKKMRKQRKPRTVSAEKKLKHFKYQKEAKDFKLVSINPEKIIGAQELWAFNTRTRALIVFRALDRNGLQINRTAITGFDDKTSMTKKTGRKTEEVVASVAKGGKIVLRKVMDTLKTSTKMQDRIGDMTVLIRVE